MDIKSVRRVLVLDTAFAGDCLLSIPLIDALKSWLPWAKIAILTTPFAQDIFLERNDVDRVFFWDKRKKRGLFSLFSIIRMLKSFNADVAISPHKSFRSSLILAMSGISLRIGFDSASLAWLYHKRVREDISKSVILRKLDLLKGLGLEVPRKFLPMKEPGYTKKDLATIQSLLGPFFSDGFLSPNLCGGGMNVVTASLTRKSEDKIASKEPFPLIGIAPGSIWPTKRWPVRYFIELMVKLKEQTGANFVLVGSKQDESISNEIESTLPFPVANLASKIKLRSLFALMTKLDLFVTNDSAPMHVAFLKEVPIVALFGPTTKSLGFASFGAMTRIAEVDLNCRPCGRHGGKACPKKHFRCMLDLNPDIVLGMVIELLQLTPKTKKDER